MAEDARDVLRARWRREGRYHPVTVGEALARGAARHGASSLWFANGAGEAEVSLAELHRDALAVAARLADAGVAAGDHVVVQAPSDRLGVAAAVAVWHLGAVLVPVAVTADGDDLTTITEQTRPKVAVVAPVWRDHDLLGPAREVVGAVVPLDASVVDRRDGQADPPVAAVDPAAAACVLYTSGSTAAPKGVRHSHETLLAGMPLDPDPAAPAAPSVLVTFPAGHVASVLGVLRPLLLGGRTVVMDRWSARRAVELITRHRIATSAGTPFFLATLLDEADRTGADLEDLQAFLVGAAAVPPALVDRAEARGIVTWRTYGSTEHPAVAAGSPLDPRDKRRDTDGTARDGNELRIVDEHGADVAAGQDGEVVCRGPKQFLGYQDPALDEEAFLPGGWFRTGDVGHLDADGHLVITDRLKDIVIRGGENVAAAEVEHALATHPSVEAVAVVASPDPLWGETVCAVVVARGAAPSLVELRDHGAAVGLAGHKLPERLELVDDLPRTPAGKVRKGDLRRSLRAGDPVPADGGGGAAPTLR